MSSHLTDRILVPIANEADAERTCRSIRQHLESDSGEARPTVVVTHVIEKADGAIDKAPLDARKEQAASIFDMVRAELEPAGYTVETELRFESDVVAAIYDTASETNAESIVFVPQEGGFLVSLLASDLTDLVTDSPIPVITLPDVPDSSS